MVRPAFRFQVKDRISSGNPQPATVLGQLYEMSRAAARSLTQDSREGRPEYCKLVACAGELPSRIALAGKLDETTEMRAVLIEHRLTQGFGDGPHDAFVRHDEQ
jgi:hypothetical protein